MESPSRSPQTRKHGLLRSVRIRSRAISLLGGLRPKIGWTSMSPRSNAHANNFLMAASTRLARYGFPSAMILSRTRTTFARLISDNGLANSGSNLRSMACVARQSRFFGRACFSMNSGTVSPKVRRAGGARCKSADILPKLHVAQEGASGFTRFSKGDSRIGAYRMSNLPSLHAANNGPGFPTRAEHAKAQTGKELVVVFDASGYRGSDRFDEARGELFAHLNCMRQRAQKVRRVSLVKSDEV